MNQTVAGGVGGIREPEACGTSSAVEIIRCHQAVSIGSCSKVSTRTAIEPIW